MDEIINSLIDGSSELAYHFSSDNSIYWQFPKQHIDNNEALLKFLKTNKKLKVEDFYKESQEFQMIYQDMYNKDLFIENDSNYLVHDSARYLIYNFCLFKLKPYLSILKTNIMNCTNSCANLVDDKFFYHYNCMSKIEEEIYSGISYKKSVRNLISRTWAFRQNNGSGHIINLDSLQLEMKRMEAKYNFSKVSFDI